MLRTQEGRGPPGPNEAPVWDGQVTAPTNHRETSMRHTISYDSGLLAVAAIAAALLVWPMAGEAQTVTGKARAVQATVLGPLGGTTTVLDRKSTRLNSSHRTISYAVFCLKKKT